MRRPSSVASESVYAPGPTAVSVAPSRRCPWSEASAVAHVLGALAQRLASRQLAEEPQSSRFAGRPVDRADPARLERELQDRLEHAAPAVRRERPTRFASTSSSSWTRYSSEPAAARTARVSASASSASGSASRMLRPRERATHLRQLPTMAWSSCSNPPVSIAQCMPHSFGAPVSHHQRPARTGSPSATGRVQGWQPIDE